MLEGLPLNGELCQNATHPSLRYIHMLSEDQFPMEHTACHTKPHSWVACNRTKVLNEDTRSSASHYSSVPEALWGYFNTKAGKVFGSSAHGYYKPLCKSGRPGRQARQA